MKITIVIGSPCSGKSTFLAGLKPSPSRLIIEAPKPISRTTYQSETVQRFHEAIIFNRDSIINSLFDDREKDIEIWTDISTLYSCICNHILLRKSFPLIKIAQETFDTSGNFYIITDPSGGFDEIPLEYQVLPTPSREEMIRRIAKRGQQISDKKVDSYLKIGHTIEERFGVKQNENS